MGRTGRRRRQKYTWMPTLGGEARVGEGEPYFTNYFGAKLAVENTAQGPLFIYVTPIVPDATRFGLVANEAEDTLLDLTAGQDWLLKRIVGKCTVAVNQFVEEPLATTPKVIFVTAGFFVGRADDNDQSQPDMRPDEYDPAATANVRNPWIWRRRWVLMNGLATAPLDSVVLEINNTSATSLADGPHIDSKVARRIRREERLWFVINGYGEDNLAGAPSHGAYSQNGAFEFSLDYRILGAMRRSNNRSTF